MAKRKCEPIDISPKLYALMQRAEKGDATALPALRLALEAQPELWQRYPTLADGTVAAWLNLVAGSDLFLRETLEHQVGELKASLRRPGATPLEELLLARIAVSWLQVHYADVIYTQLKGSKLPLAEMKAAEQRLHRADLRYRAALKQLATLRRLVPVLPAPGKAERQVQGCAPRRSSGTRPASQPGARA